VFPSLPFPVLNEEGRGANAYILSCILTANELSHHTSSDSDRTRADQEHSHRLRARNTDRPSRVQGFALVCPANRIFTPAHRGLITDRETPRTPRTAARGHASRLNRRARRARHRVGAVARRMGPAEKSVLQVRAPFPFLDFPRSTHATGANRLPNTRLTIFLNSLKAFGRSFPTRCHRLTRTNSRRILGSSTIRPNISSWNADPSVRLHMLPSVADPLLRGSGRLNLIALFALALLGSFDRTHARDDIKCDDCVHFPYCNENTN
jgi:hypothetical protein